MQSHFNSLQFYCSTKFQSDINVTLLQTDREPVHTQNSLDNYKLKSCLIILKRRGKQRRQQQCKCLCRPDRACRADGFWCGSKQLRLSSLHKGKVSEELRGESSVGNTAGREQAAGQEQCSTHVTYGASAARHHVISLPSSRCACTTSRFEGFYFLETEISLKLYRAYSNVHKTIFHMEHFLYILIYLIIFALVKQKLAKNVQVVVQVYIQLQLQEHIHYLNGCAIFFFNNQ